MNRKKCMEYSTLQKGVKKKKNERRYKKKGNQSRGSKYNLGESSMSKFLLHTFTRLVAHLRPQGRGGGDERESEPNCLVIWLFCYHHHKSRMKLIESSRKVYFLYSYEKAERKKRKEKKKTCGTSRLV